MTDLTVFTSNFSTPAADMSHLRRSCEINGIDLQTYGEGLAWPGYVGGKIVAALEYLKTVKTPYAMFVDSRDSLIFGTEQQIIDLYHETTYHQASTLISGERTCWPDDSISKVYDYINEEWRFPNAGGWIGVTAILKDQLEHMIDIGKKRGFGDDDQRHWHGLFEDQAPFLSVDGGCNLFQCMGGENHTVYIERGSNYGKPYNAVTGGLPLVLHFNGRTPGIEQWLQRLETR